MEKPIVQYLIVNSDLNMGKGKIASQIGHCVNEITERIIISAYESKKPPEYYSTYMKWKMHGSAKIVLKASGEKLQELMKLDHCIPVYDAGKTQIEAGSLTCIGFYPSSEIGVLLKDLKLL
ncbi:peptidyl-tRNA hydrolase [Klosneuvirus KNV1]|uniref:peptidyl-tRNA hydrolase n=1 Tax=Klosneuvirus KNV1 TaxID=1977640 RepID=A0A1V0SJY8_9VIRU|nr:peptidyl-tRNA hydrolase [Klosneuvirus KNV1]